VLVTSQSQQDREQQLEDEIVALRQEKERTKPCSPRQGAAC